MTLLEENRQLRREITLLNEEVEAYEKRNEELVKEVKALRDQLRPALIDAEHARYRQMYERAAQQDLGRAYAEEYERYMMEKQRHALDGFNRVMQRGAKPKMQILDDIPAAVPPTPFMDMVAAAPQRKKNRHDRRRAAKEKKPVNYPVPDHAIEIEVDDYE
jgi:cell division septum initiation protein DivIVA